MSEWLNVLVPSLFTAGLLWFAS